jgi:hypothetical protein
MLGDGDDPGECLKGHPTLTRCRRGAGVPAVMP